MISMKYHLLLVQVRLVDGSYVLTIEHEYTSRVLPYFIVRLLLTL